MAEAGTHTPGPWRWNATPPGRYVITTTVMDFPGTPDVVLAEVFVDGVDPYEEIIIPESSGEPNARLMAAAPDMRQALEEVLGDCYYLDNPGGIPRCNFCQELEGDPHDQDCTMQVVLAALAKATGEALPVQPTGDLPHRQPQKTGRRIMTTAAKLARIAAAIAELQAQLAALQAGAKKGRS
jgi:hypothetical protein